MAAHRDARVAMEYFISKIARTTWVQNIKSRSLEENLDLLRTEMQELDSWQTDVIIALHTAKVADGKTPKAEIWESLMDHEVRIIGVYGMEGVGKTTIMTQMYNRIKSSKIFGIAIWVTVSNDFSIEKLQNLIAQEIKLELSYEKDEIRRSMKLFQALKRRKKFVIILDDMWKPFPFEKVGIPEGNTNKIVLTTRSKNVCRGMGCQKKFEVEVLSREEAWELFKERLGADVVLSPEVERIAKLVTEECGSLPLRIITIARAMREKNDIREWRNALEELKCSTMEIECMDD
ncbi:probable disease resistance protein At1g52660 [Magnolia sinica]|uniref:probable disease resistance protein At1g52660 n=1 Tax=Magnolia sinica TaxID=86752 RepID=UPI00265A46D8|nr:probable disease resistance protein At1g52660 [Magnolia sinica]